MAEGVVAWISYDGTKSYFQREEALRHCFVPYLETWTSTHKITLLRYLCRQDLFKIGSDKEKDSFGSAGKRYTSDKKSYEDHVREGGSKVGNFAGWSDAFGQRTENKNPAEEETERKTPIGITDSAVHIRFLSHDIITSKDQKGIISDLLISRKGEIK